MVLVVGQVTFAELFTVPDKFLSISKLAGAEAGVVGRAGFSFSVYERDSSVCMHEYEITVLLLMFIHTHFLKCLLCSHPNLCRSTSLPSQKILTWTVPWPTEFMNRFDFYILWHGVHYTTVHYT